MKTEILPVGTPLLAASMSQNRGVFDDWTLDLPHHTAEFRNLRRAADEIVSTDIPVAFPTETVYGLGADATRSEAVRGIFEAKQRPSDNPLIVHVHSLGQLRKILRPNMTTTSVSRQQSRLHRDDHSKGESLDQENGVSDPIPSIYYPLITKFWPGPLTLIMPNPSDSKLAREVTAGLQTVGVRMPQNLHALALLKMTNVPLAAPSANASTKPSPTTAEHVLHDLDGRISTIIDGGPCEVGVESTVVDGLCNPPAILRPGGISIDELRECEGWRDVVLGYKDSSQSLSGPRAPGMKYKHYSPEAVVLLAEPMTPLPTLDYVRSRCSHVRSIGVIRTLHWSADECLHALHGHEEISAIDESNGEQPSNGTTGANKDSRQLRHLVSDSSKTGHDLTIWDIKLGPDAEHIAQGLFATLRMLDLRNVDVILVEGIDDGHKDLAAAIMNRLRKAAMPTISDGLHSRQG